MALAGQLARPAGQREPAGSGGPQRAASGRRSPATLNGATLAAGTRLHQLLERPDEAVVHQPLLNAGDGRYSRSSSAEGARAPALVHHLAGQAACSPARQPARQPAGNL